MSRLRQALDAVKGDAYDEPQVRGFDVACVPKPKLFGRNKNRGCSAASFRAVDGDGDRRGLDAGWRSWNALVDRRSLRVPDGTADDVADANWRTPLPPSAARPRPAGR